MAGHLLQPALIGGLVMGVLSALPFVSAGNLCCCLWVVSGGFAAAYLLQQNQQDPLTSRDGALVGLMAGLFGAAVYLILAIPVTLLLAPMQQQVIERLIDGGQLPAEFREFLTSSAGGVAGLAGSFVLMLVAGVVFSTLGGLLGTAVFRKRAPLPPGVPPP
jgi:hypothetical protein